MTKTQDNLNPVTVESPETPAAKETPADKTTEEKGKATAKAARTGVPLRWRIGATVAAVATLGGVVAMTSGSSESTAPEQGTAQPNSSNKTPSLASFLTQWADESSALTVETTDSSLFQSAIEAFEPDYAAVQEGQSVQVDYLDAILFIQSSNGKVFTAMNPVAMGYQPSEGTFSKDAASPNYPGKILFYELPDADGVRSMQILAISNGRILTSDPGARVVGVLAAAEGPTIRASSLQQPNGPVSDEYATGDQWNTLTGNESVERAAKFMLKNDHSLKPASLNTLVKPGTAETEGKDKKTGISQGELQTWLSSWQEDANRINFKEDPAKTEVSQGVVAHFEEDIHSAAPNSNPSTILYFLDNTLVFLDTPDGTIAVQNPPIVGFRQDTDGGLVSNPDLEGTAGVTYDNFVMLYQDQDGEWQGITIQPSAGGVGYPTQAGTRIAFLAFEKSTPPQGTDAAEWEGTNKPVIKRSQTVAGSYDYSQLRVTLPNGSTLSLPVEKHYKSVKKAVAAELLYSTQWVIVPLSNLHQQIGL